MNEKAPSDDDGDADSDDSLSELVDSIKNRQQSSETDDSTPRDSLAELADSPDEFIWGPDSESTEDTANGNGFDDDVREKLADAGNVLVLGSLRGTTCNSTCVRLLMTPPATGVLYVTATHSIENRVDVTKEYTDQLPEHISVLRVGGDERSRERSTLTTRSGPLELSVQGVSDPSDLTRLGIAINRHLSEWERSTRTTVCVHSLTEFLQYVNEQRLFRFIHILQAKLESANTVAHFHLDPESHSEQTVSVFQTLFDYVVEVDEDGTVSVKETDD